MRRRARGRVRTARRKGCWLNAIGAVDCAVQLTRNECGEGFQPANTDLFLLVDNPVQPVQGSVSSVGEATLVRLVGEICISKVLAGQPNSSWVQSTYIIMGIYIADFANNGIPITRSPALDVENGDWLWRGTYADTQCGTGAVQNIFICTENNATGGGVSQSNGSHIDVKVKRKLKREESILLAVDFIQDDVILSGGGNPVPAAFITGNVRAYVLEP